MKRRDKLVVVHSIYPQDPRVRKQTRAVVARGYAVDIVCLRGEGQSRFEQDGDVRIYRLPMQHDRSRGLGGYVYEYAGFALMAFFVVTWLWLRHRHRIVKVHNMPDALVFTALVPRLCGARVVFDIHDFMPELFESRYGGSRMWLVRLLARIERMAWRFSHAIVTTHERASRRLLDRGVSPAKLTVVMNTAPMVDERPAMPPRDGELRVVYHGLLSDVYDLETAVRAVGELRRAGGPPVRLWLVGIGPRADALRTLAADAGAADAVTFEGWVQSEAIPGVLRRSHAGYAVLLDRPHQQIALPTKLFEAIASGLPVITSRTTIVTDFVDERDVLFVEPGNVAQTAAAFRHIANDAESAERLVAHAWRTVHPLRWQVMADRYVALMDVLSARG